MSRNQLSKNISNIISNFSRVYESFTKGASSVTSYNHSDHGNIVQEDVPSRYDIIDQYWVNPPFAYISICTDTDNEEEIYYLSTPELTSFETELLNGLKQDIRDRLLYMETDMDLSSETTLQQIMDGILAQYGVNLEPRSFFKLLYYITRDFRGFDKLQPLLNDPHIEDISCDGPQIPVFLYHDEYDNIKTNIEFEEEYLDDLIIQLAQASGRQVSVGSPITNATLPDGSRAELVYTEEVSPKGSAFTIRKYSEDAMTPVDLIKHGTFSLDQMAYFWLAIENNMNLIFAGGTASGKTTSLNAVSMFVPPRSKVITIEDTREISLSHENWLSNVTREQGTEENDVEMYHLLRSALRHRPEYIIVGEIRGEEATTLFQAMNTGHTTFSTMHADSIQTVINRLENDPINIPRPMIQSLDILSVQKLVRVDGERERRSARISEIQNIDQRTGELNYSGVYEWNGSTDSFDGSATSSEVLEEIKEDHGWSETQLLTEFRNRKLVLKFLLEEDVTDLTRFTSIINKYWRDPGEVIDTANEELDRTPEVT